MVSTDRSTGVRCARCNRSSCCFARRSTRALPRFEYESRGRRTVIYADYEMRSPLVVDASLSAYRALFRLVKCADDYEVLLPAVSMMIGPSIMWLTSSL